MTLDSAFRSHSYSSKWNPLIHVPVVYKLLVG